MKKIQDWIKFFQTLNTGWQLLIGVLPTVLAIITLAKTVATGPDLIIGLSLLGIALTIILIWKQKSLLKKPLIILSAEWDAEGPEPKDITRRVRSLVTAEGTLKIDTGRYVQLFGDTAKVPGKKCRVSYCLHSEITTEENEDLILPRRSIEGEAKTKLSSMMNPKIIEDIYGPGKKIYLVEDGKRLHIPNPATYHYLGELLEFDWLSRVPMAHDEIKKYRPGRPLPDIEPHYERYHPVEQIIIHEAISEAKDSGVNIRQLLELAERIEQKIREIPNIKKLGKDHLERRKWQYALERYIPDIDNILPGHNLEDRRAKIAFHPPDKPETEESVKRGVDMMAAFLEDVLSLLREEITSRQNHNPSSP